MNEEITIDTVLDRLEKPILAYVQDLMTRLGMPIKKEEAENIISNIGMRIWKRKQTPQ